MNSNSFVDEWIARIKEAYVAHDFDVAQSLMDEALLQTSSDPKLLEISGMMAYEQGDYEDCIQQIGSAMFEVSLSVTAQLTLANAWLKLGKYESAEETLAFLVEIVDRVPCSMLPELTQAVVQLERNDLAVAVCKEAIQRHPDDDNAAFGVGFYMFRDGSPLLDAKEWMKEGVRLNATCSFYRLNLAVVCIALEQWQEAYAHACRVPVPELRNLNCECLAEQLKTVFLRFDDFERLSEL